MHGTTIQVQRFYLSSLFTPVTQPGFLSLSGSFSLLPKHFFTGQAISVSTSDTLSQRGDLKIG